ncbi:hypothetical protein GCM10010170_084500 [Dactylosporangium salmoneum]|uniref:Uncharacterized protein n=1 Tax=Dactylosporangium salmoneum TaxID=53361 RepID=A0ABN3HFG7_9ACTN
MFEDDEQRQAHAVDQLIVTGHPVIAAHADTVPTCAAPSSDIDVLLDAETAGCVSLPLSR